MSSGSLGEILGIFWEREGPFSSRNAGRYTLAQSMSFAAGDRLGPFEIETLLGAGGMGEVYGATDTRLGRRVALKVLPLGAAHDERRRQRFEREARAISALSHPNICALYD